MGQSFRSFLYNAVPNAVIFNCEPWAPNNMSKYIRKKAITKSRNNVQLLNIPYRGKFL